MMIDKPYYKTVTTQDYDDFGYNIVTEEDVTIIQYWELENNLTVIKWEFSITSGYDVNLFAAAIKQRKNYEEITS